MKVSFFDIKIEKYIERLDVSTQAKVFHTIDLLKHFGNQLGFPHSKKLTKDLCELRIQGKQAIRLLYTFYNGDALVLHIFTKKTQKTPRNELGLAMKRIKLLQDA